MRASQLVAEAMERRILLSWTGATSGSTNDSAHLYNSTANWAGGIIDDSFAGVTLTSNTVLYFNAARTTTSTGLNLGYNGNYSLTLESTNSSAQALTLAGNISGPAVTQAVTIGNSTDPLNVALGSSARTVTLSSGSSLIFQNAVSGTGSLAESGSGTLTLAGANTNSGGVNLSGGQLNINSATALGVSRLTINSGIIDNTSGAAVTLSGTILQTWAGSFTFVGTNSLTMGSGAVTLSSSITITTSTGTLADSGIVSDGGGGYSITKTGAGTLTLSGVNTFSGGTVLSVGQLNINNAKAIGTGTFTINGGVIDNTSGSSITLGNNAQTWAGSFTFTGTAALNLGTGAITLSVSPTVTLGGASLTVAGIISGAQSLTKAGSGTLILSGANTFSGGVSLAAGQLNINGATALGTGAFIVNAGTSVDNTSGSTIVESSNNVESWNGSFTFVGTYGLNLGTGAITLGTNLSLSTTASFLTISGVIGDSGNSYSLTKSGAGTLALTAANTFAGGVSIAGGILSFVNGTLGTGNVSFNGSSTLQWNGTNTQDVSSKLGPIASGVTATFDTGANAVTFATAISGAGGIKKVGSGTLTLSAANTYAGGLTLGAGQINLNSATAPGTGTFTISGGIIDNTSGAAVTLSNNNSMVWSASFTFTGSNALNLGTGGVTLTATPTITTTASNLTVGGVLSGAFGLTKSGTNGTLTLSGANNYTGTTVFSSGTIAVNNASALGTGTFNLSGGKIDNTTGGAIALSTSNPINFTANSIFTGTNALTLGSGALTMTASVTLTNTASTLAIPGNITGAFILTKAGNGTLALSGNNTFSGGFKLTAGTIDINVATALGTGTFTPSGGTIDNTTASAVTVTNPVSLAGNLTFAGTNSLTFATGAVTLTAARTITVTAGTLAMAGAIGDGGSGYKMTAAGSGALLLSGVNTFGGGVGLSAATLDINSAQAIGTGALTITSGTIDNTSGSPVTLSSNNTQTWGGAFVFGGHNNLNMGTGVVTLSANATVNASAGTLTIAGVIAGAKSLTKIGGGTLALVGASNYSLGTIVSAGTLVVNNINGSGTGTGSVTVSSGATLTGNGNVTGAITIGSGANFTPGWGAPAIFNTGNLTLNSGANLNIVINGNTAGTNYSQLNITGTASINGSNLNLSGSRAGHDGTILTLITNDGSDAITGTFASLAQRAQTAALNATPYNASYTGGTGNEFTLTAVLASTSTTLTSSTSPSTYNQSVTFTATESSSGSGTPTGNVTFKSGSTTLGTSALNASGAAIYSTSTLPVGSDSITAVYSGDSTFLGGTSSTITQVVTAGPPTQLAYAHQPGTAAAGTAVSPAITVDVEDQFGNVAATDSSAVSITVATGPGAASGTLTVNAVNGVATFSNVQFSTAGRYTLTAADGSLQSATSNSFTVTAGTPRLTITQQPANVTAGVSPIIQVDVEDQFGNIVTTDNSTVALSVATGPGVAGGTLSVSTVNGVANFSNVILTAAGNYTLSASDSSLTPATSNGFVVAPASSAQLIYARQPGDVAAGVAISLAPVVNIEDQFGNIATADNSTVTLSVATGPGALTGTISIAAANGVATFSNVILNTAGTYTIDASDASLTSATSNSVTVSPAAAVRLAYIQQPTNGMAGVAESPAITVAVEDQFGNLITSDNSSVALSLATGSGSLGGVTSVAAVNGVATFSNLILTAAGSDSLSATDGSLTTASSTSFTVTPAAADQLVYLQQPSNVIAGVTISPAISVNVEDQFGNIVTTDSSTVTLSVNTGPAAATGTLSVAAVNGVALFGNVILSTAGAYTLAATDASLTPLTSASFTVNPAAAAQLIYAQQPSNAFAGVAQNPAIAVQIEDEFGNFVTSDNSTVTVALASGPGVASGTTHMTAVNGVATFGNVILNTAGTCTLSATDASLTSAISNSFIVSPAEAVQLVYTRQPSNVTAGIANIPAVMVSVEDQFGNIEISDASTLSLSVASGPGTITGTAGTAAVNGVATFNNVTLNTTGTYTLAATDGLLTVATSTNFNVTPAAAAKLVFAQQPGNVTAGQQITPNPVIIIQDQFGNTITDDSSGVTLAVATGSGNLQETFSVNAVNGMAMFSNLSLNNAGMYLLRATDSSLTSAMSTTFTVAPAAATQLVYSQQPTNVVASIAITPAIIVKVEDSFGNIVTSDHSTVTLSPSSGSDTFGDAAVNGIATFNNVTLDNAGTYTLVATDASVTSATSSSFVVSPAGGTKLVLAQQPGNVTAGQVLTPVPVVIIEDQFGNVISSDSSAVTLSAGSGPGSLRGTTTLNAVNGVATFNNVYWDAAGNYTLSATRTGLTPATSASFLVTPAAASQLVYVQQPTQAVAGVADSPAIVLDVEDPFGNLVTADPSTVTLSAASGPGTATGTLSVSAVNGVATFSSVILNTAGSYVLNAIDGSVTPAFSSNYLISPAVAAKLIYTQQPAETVVGMVESPAIVVNVEDQFGNLVATDSSTVLLASASGPGALYGTLSVAAINGVATFNNVVLNTAGVYTLNATDVNLVNATSNSFTVTATAASQLTFVQQPTDAVAGVADSPAIQVEVEDRFGNIVSSDNSLVTITVNTGPGGPGGTLSVMAVSGLATFNNIYFDIAGTYTLSFTDAALMPAISGSFHVNPAATAQLAFLQQPSSVAAGDANRPAVEVGVEDQYGNIVTADQSTVTLAVNTGPGVAAGTLNVAAVSGIATFNNLVFTTSGLYSLGAIDASLTPATSGNFNVLPAVSARLAYLQQPANVTAGVVESPAVAVGIYDFLGNLATGDNSVVALSVASGPGPVGGRISVAAVDGVATFNDVVLDIAGTYELSSADASLIQAISTDFTVTSAASVQLVFVQQPSNAVAGVADSPATIVQVEDQFGNLVDGDNSTVTMSVSSGPGEIDAPFTAAAERGVATFGNLNLDVAGAYILSASDGALTAATSASFSILPASANQLFFAQQPSNLSAGQTLTPAPAVNIEDRFGNIVTSDGSTVSLSVTGPGSVRGALNIDAVNGVASFANLELITAGVYTLNATGPGLTWTLSSSFTVSPANAQQLAFVQQPGDALAGVAVSPSIALNVEDSFGNVVSTDHSAVSLAIYSGPEVSGGPLTIAAVNGVAIFDDLILDITGVYSLEGDDLNLTPAVSASFTVSPAAAAKLVYVRQPTNFTAGVAADPAIDVTVEDLFGNAVTDFSSTVTLSIASGPGIFATTPSATPVGGVASFNDVTLDTAGAYTITANGVGLMTAISDGFTVIPAAASQLIFSAEPSTTVAGVAISPAVTVEVADQFANVVASDDSTVTLSVESGAYTAAVAAVSGVAVFDDLVLDTAGVYILSASDGNLATATSVSFRINPAVPSQLVYEQQPSNVVAGSAIGPAIEIAIEDQFGNIETGNNSTVTLSTLDGTIGGVRAVSAIDGVATFNSVILYAAGNYTLSAYDAGIAPVTSTGFSVDPASSAQLLFAQQPLNAVAGVTDSPATSVKVLDRYGNLVTADQSTVLLSVATGPGTIAGTFSVAAVNGVASFSNLVFDTAGTYMLSAARVSLTPATSMNFTITSALAAQLVYSQQPGNGVAGVAIGPGIVVNVEDQYGNVVTNDSSTVTLSPASGPGSLSGAFRVEAIQGVATFENVVLYTSGAYTLSAGDSGLTAALSNSFTIGPATPAQLVYMQEPSNTTAGIAMSPVIVVEVEDQFGNLVSDDDSMVNLSIAGGGGSVEGISGINAVNGIAIFDDVIVETAGTDSIIASGAGLGSTASTSFIISPAAAAQLEFIQQPTNAIAGAAINPAIKVVIEDQFRNIVTPGGSNATISIASGPGPATGILSVAAIGGMATFGNVVLETDGTYRLSVIDGSLTQATSASFTILQAVPSQLVYVRQPSDAVAGVIDSSSIVVNVEDRFGNVASGDNSMVTLSVASGPGVVSGLTIVPAVNGVATFSGLILDAAGTYTLSTSDANLSRATSDRFTITAAAAVMLAYIQQPTNVIAGVTESPAVTLEVEDEFGNRVISDGSTIALSAPGANGTLNITAISGLAIFNDVRLNVAGTYRLNAVDGSFGLANSQSFSVSPAAASQLKFTQQPGDANAGHAMSPAPIVNVEDQFGNTVAGDNSTVTMSVATGPGTLLGTVSASTMNGVASFNDLLLDAAGMYTLLTTDGSLAATTSAGFRVSPGSPSQLVFSHAPSDVLANSPDAPAIVVNVEDSFENLINSDNSLVTLSVASGLGSAYGGTVIAAVGGIATFTEVKFDTVGIHTLVAQDGSLAGANSPAFVVNPDPTTCAVASSVNPSNFGQAVVLTASVINSVQGAPVPTGSITFMDGPVILGSVPLDASGTAALNISSLSPGQHPVTAVFVNDPDYLPSTSPVWSQRVFQDESAVSLSAIPNPGTFGKEVTFTANVTAAPPGSGTPTGSVTLSDGTTILSTVPLINGVATFTTSSLLVGSHSIMAAYSGDSDFTGAVSPTYTEAITQTASQLAIIEPPSDAVAGQSLGDIQVDVEDADGNVVTGDFSSITVSSDTSIGGATNINVINGVATVNDLAIDPAGLHQLLFADGSLSPALSDPITIVPAAPAQMAFINQPQSTTTGASLGQVLVAVEDIYGNVVTADSSTIILSNAPLSGSNSAPVLNGIAEFDNLSIATAGQYTLTASDGSLTLATSNPITISYPAVSGSKVAPILVDVSGLLSPTRKQVSKLPLRIEYQNGSRVTVLKLTVPVKNGTATIKNLKFNKAGTYTLTISGNNGSSITRQITVAPTAPFKLVFLKSASKINGTATFQVQVADRQGNLCSGDNDTIITLAAAARAVFTGDTTATVVNAVATFNLIQFIRSGKATLIAQAPGLVSAKFAIVQVLSRNPT